VAQDLLFIIYRKTNCEKMKPVSKTLVLFVCSFAVGVCIAPVFEIEEEPVSEPTEKPIQHYRNRYGESIKRTV
jgi:hypothetical protein